jgi:glucose/arabinose dehydrogenase
MVRTTRLIVAVAAALVLASCGDSATLPEEASEGSDPPLPEPVHSLFPTVNIARVVGWSGNAKPKAGEGLAVNAFATGLDHPRWLLVLPNGDVLAAESNAPERRSGDSAGIRGFIAKIVLSLAGAGVPSPNKIVLLRDTTAAAPPI